MNGAESDVLQWGHRISTTHDAVNVEALDVNVLDHDAPLLSGCSFSNDTACFN